MSGPAEVWYVAYGSNLYADRLACYLRGGTPPGAAYSHPGCRDQTPPRRNQALMVPGEVYFALESATWTGGSAFYDPALPGPTPVRAYLMTAGQFSDVTAQEGGHAPGRDLDLGGVLRDGRHQIGPSRYETLLHLGTLEDRPMLTFSAPFGAADVTCTAPSAAYLRMLGFGLREAHGWDARRAAAYLCGLRGAAGAWDVEDVAALLDTGDLPPSG